MEIEITKETTLVQLRKLSKNKKSMLKVLDELYSKQLGIKPRNYIVSHNSAEELITKMHDLNSLNQVLSNNDLDTEADYFMFSGFNGTLNNVDDEIYKQSVEDLKFIIENLTDKQRMQLVIIFVAILNENTFNDNKKQFNKE